MSINILEMLLAYLRGVHSNLNCKGGHNAQNEGSEIKLLTLVKVNPQFGSNFQPKQHKLT